METAAAELSGAGTASGTGTAVVGTDRGRAAEYAGWQRVAPAIAICLVLVRSRMLLLLTPQPVYDFMTYWAAGRLFLYGANPYSAAAMYGIERALGWGYLQPLVLLNPPWTLPLVAPLGMLPFAVAHVLWLVVSLGLESVSALALWQYFGGQRGQRWMALALVLTFLPAGSAEHMGQITPLMLAGLTGFLVALGRRRYALAGVCLLLLGAKPHLVYLVALAVVLWAVQERRWRLLGSAALAYGGAAAAALAYNRNAMSYFHGAAQAAMDTACGVGGALRSVFGADHVWLQWAPMLVGTAWFAWYWSRHRNDWRWEERLPLVLLVSMGTAPYSWAHDYVLALPAMVALTVRLARTRTDWLIPAAVYLVVQMAIFTVAAPYPKQWMATASVLWLGLYWAGARHAAALEAAG